MTTVTITNGKITTNLYRKPTNRVQYLLPDYCHPSHVTNSISYSLALQIVRICSEPEEREVKMEELRQKLISRNYNRNIVNAAIIKAKCVIRELALQKVVKKKNERVIFVLTFNPRLPSISNIMVRYWRTLTKDKKMLEMFPSPPMVAFRQPSNLKALLCKAKLQIERRFPPKRGIPGMKKCRKCPIDIHIEDEKKHSVLLTQKSAFASNVNLTVEPQELFTSLHVISAKYNMLDSLAEPSMIELGNICTVL